jgi:hypothetical protein
MTRYVRSETSRTDATVTRILRGPARRERRREESPGEGTREGNKERGDGRRQRRASGATSSRTTARLVLALLEGEYGVRPGDALVVERRAE